MILFSFWPSESFLKPLVSIFKMQLMLRTILKSNIVAENMVQENTELPDYGSFFNLHWIPFADYIHSEVLRFVTIIWICWWPKHYWNSIALAIPLVYICFAIPRISTRILPFGPNTRINLPSGSITISALASFPIFRAILKYSNGVTVQK